MHGKREVEFLNWIKQYGGVNGNKPKEEKRRKNKKRKEN